MTSIGVPRPERKGFSYTPPDVTVLSMERVDENRDRAVRVARSIAALVMFLIAVAVVAYLIATA